MDTRKRSTAGRLVLSAAVGAGALALGGGLAEGAARKATLSVHPPKHAKVGVQYTIKASGYSGKFDRIGIVGSKIKCPKNAVDAYATFGGFYVQTVKKHHSFKKKDKFTASSAGKRYACVYLYDSADPAGKQKHKSKTFVVSQ